MRDGRSEVDVNETSIAAHQSLMQKGIVEAQLPSGLYRGDVDGGRQITGQIGGGLKRNFVRFLVSDRVVVALTSRDLMRGRYRQEGIGS
jgi:translation initiation factor IF-1